MATVDELMNGSIDMHMHTAPDPNTERRLDALEAAFQAEDMGMRAIVLKSHEYPTTPLAYIVQQMVDNVKVFGSLCLEFQTGCLNLAAVEASAKLGAKVLWMPTFSGTLDRKKRGLPGISILDEKGELFPVVSDILKVVKSHDMVLASGHITNEETFALVDEAKRLGLTKIVATHPTSPNRVPMTLKQLQDLTAKGVLIEYCFGSCMPLSLRLNPADIAAGVKALGAEHCLMTTDLGQNHNPPPAEGMRMCVIGMLRNGISEPEVELMTKVNPARLLGLD